MEDILIKEELVKVEVDNFVRECVLKPIDPEFVQQRLEDARVRDLLYQQKKKERLKDVKDAFPYKVNYSRENVSIATVRAHCAKEHLLDWKKWGPKARVMIKSGTISFKHEEDLVLFVLMVM